MFRIEAGIWLRMNHFGGAFGVLVLVVVMVDDGGGEGVSGFFSIFGV